MVDSTTQYAETIKKQEKEFLSLYTITLHLLGTVMPSAHLAGFYSYVFFCV